jgi:hypothetical protein
MSDYGEIAKLASSMARKGISPIKAWESSAQKTFPTQKSSREKGCPKCTFLGLAEEGLIKGVPAGSYTSSKNNKHYALAAIDLLRANPSLSGNTAHMWRMVMQGTEKQHNQQMNVVSSLWQNGDIQDAI